MNEGPSPGQRSYWCFISYRHADNKEPGRQWATWLHQAIETYEVPEDLVGTVNERGDTIPTRIFPVFRDEEELPVDADLASPIYRALDATKFLIVICSPRAVASPYVGSEIRYFKQLGHGERVLAVMVEGEPNASWDAGKQAQGISAGQECFPEAMRHKVAADGSLLSEQTEPIAADFRLGHAQGWTSPEAYRLALQREGLVPKEITARVEDYRRQSELMKLKIIAGILGVPLGTLTNRDAAYQLVLAQKRARLRNAVLAVVSVLAIAAFVGGVIAYLKQQEAVAQRYIADQKTAEAVQQKGIAEQETSEAVQQKGIAQKETAEAVKQKGIAEQQTAETLAEKERALETLARSDFAQAESQIREGDRNAAMAYLARSLRSKRDHNPASYLAFDLLLQQPVLRAVLSDHTDTVTAAAFSPDGTRVASISKDRSLRIWDARTGQCLTSIKAEDDGDNVYENVSYSPDGTQILTAGRNFGNGSICAKPKIWDAKTGQLVSELGSGDGGTSWNYATYSPDGTKVVACSFYMARVFDAKTGRPLTPPLPATDAADRENYRVSNAAFSPDSKKVALAFNHDTGAKGNTGGVQIFDSQTGNPITPVLTAGLIAMAFSLDSTRLLSVTGSKEPTLVVTNISTGTLVSAFKPVTPYTNDPMPDFPTSVNSAEFSPDRSSVLLNFFGFPAQAFNISTGQPTTAKLPHAAGINYGEYSPDGTEIVTASEDGTAKIWELKNGKFGATLQQDGPVTFAGYSQDGNRILTLSGNHVYIWDYSTGPMGPPVYHVLLGENAAFSLDGKLAGETYRENCARVLSTPNLDPVSPLLQHAGFVHSIEFSPDSTRVVTGSDDKTARVWDAHTGQAITPPLKCDSPVSYACFSPDGTRVVTSSDGTRVWDAKTGQPVTPVMFQTDDDMTFFACFSPDGTKVVSASNMRGIATVWDARTGKKIAGPFRHSNSLYGAAFSPDGERIVTASKDCTARVWDVATGQPLTPPLKHASEVLFANFNSDGSLVMTCSQDHSARVWDVASGQPVTLPLPHGTYVYKAAFGADSRELFTLSGADEPGSHNVQVWDLAPPSAPPDWLSDVLEAAALIHINDRGVLEPIGPEKYLELRKERLASISNDPWEVFGHWYFSDPATRTTSPWNALAMADYVRKLIDVGTPFTLDKAKKLSFGMPDWQAQITAKRATLAPH